MTVTFKTTYHDSVQYVHVWIFDAPKRFQYALRSSHAPEMSPLLYFAYVPT